ncbi:hypothetical protein FE697_010905 [Mumia zhuanghuii]|uniref:DUF6113 family protein n=2 Tax=Mumia TaxID=1546255 RepID=A0ABW1QGQ5_9ACTN|nr:MULTISPECIES: DUF6113 family protein [Mumia]KAA1422683.1 hypothetical protein FE697_010905 [Mumia zhuanghuii]
MPRPLALALAALLGVALCVAGLVVHRHVDASIPWGLVLTLATVVVTIRAAGYAVGKAGAYVLAGAYAVVLFLGTSSRPEGDYLVAADTLGYAFLLGSLAALVVGIVWTTRGAGHTVPGPAGGPRTLGS